MVPLIIDHRLPDGTGSLLAVPVGPTTLVNHILEWLGDQGSQEAIILPSFEPDENYAESLSAQCAHDIFVVERGLSEALDRLESSDYLLIADSKRVPLAKVDLDEVCPSLQEYHGVRHLVAMGPGNQERALERIECDEHGQVRRVQRLMPEVHWPHVANHTVLMTIVAVESIRDVAFKTLDELRQSLAGRGAIMRDEPIAVELVDLTNPSGLLLLNERLTTAAMRNGISRRFLSRGKDVLYGKNSRIDPSARLVGPLIVHEDVTIEAGVTMIGPGVVGKNCRIERGAMVARSLLCSGARVESGTLMRHCVATGRCTGTMDRPAAEIFAAPLLTGGMNGAAATDAMEPSGARKFHLGLKRAFDVFCSSVLLILASPIMLLVTLLVKLESRGPVLFVHRRERKGGTGFPCYKFRTMVADAHRQQRELYRNSEVDGPQFKMVSDPRVTRMGAFLRTTNLDELPQLFNVFLGHMSLVGPRPSPFRENQICIPWRRARLSVRPGITGLWQVCRSKDRSRGDFHEWIYYDLNYVRHFSIWLDLRILFATLLTMGGKFNVPMAWVLWSGHARR